MKNVNVLLTYLSLVAIVVLFVLHFSQPAAVQNTQTPASSDVAIKSGERLPIAYVNTDSLLLNYKMAKDLNEELIKQQEDARTNLNEEARVLESSVVEHQRKIQDNGNLSLDRAKSEEYRLQQQNSKLTDLSNRLSNEIAEKQMKVSEQLRDSIVNFLEYYNTTHNYELILSNTLGGNVLYAKKMYNITDDVLKGLNARYKK